MLGDNQLEEMRKFFSADSPFVNMAREAVEEGISDMLDLSGIDMSEQTSTKEIGLEARARVLAAVKIRDLYNHIGFNMASSTKQDRKKSWR